MCSATASRNDLEKRVEALELQNRRLRFLATLVLCGLVAVLLTAQRPRTRTLEAEIFVLKDDRGKKRAELLMDEAGPGLVLYSPAGNRVGRFGATEEGMSAGISLQAANGVSQATLISLLDGPHLLLFDSDGRFRSEHGAGRNGPYLYFHDSQGNRRISMVVESDRPKIQLEDAEGFTSVLGSSSIISVDSREVEKTNAASLVLYGREKEMLWRAP